MVKSIKYLWYRLLHCINPKRYRIDNKIDLSNGLDWQCDVTYMIDTKTSVIKVIKYKYRR